RPAVERLRAILFRRSHGGYRRIPTRNALTVRLDDFTHDFTPGGGVRRELSEANGRRHLGRKKRACACCPASEHGSMPGGHADKVGKGESARARTSMPGTPPTLPPARKVLSP